MLFEVHIPVEVKLKSTSAPALSMYPSMLDCLNFLENLGSGGRTCVWVRILSDEKFHRSKILDFMRRDYPSYNWSIATLDRCDI